MVEYEYTVLCRSHYNYCMVNDDDDDDDDDDDVLN